MRWLWLVAAAVCFIVPFVTNSIGLGGLSLLAALVFLVVGVLSLASGRIEGRARDTATMLGPDELRVMREQAERRKREQAGEGSVPAGGDE